MTRKPYACFIAGYKSFVPNSSQLLLKVRNTLSSHIQYRYIHI